MKSNQKLLLSLFPGVIFGMLLQNYLTETKLEDSLIVSLEDVNSATNRFKQDATITAGQKVFSAAFDKEEVMNIVGSANENVYVRIGMVNNKMTLYIGNDNRNYLKPNADGYCPNNCPVF